jgi:hypothetical protein
MSVPATSIRLRFLEELAYLPRVTVRDGRAIEQALAGPDLLQPGVQLTGAIVEAPLAHHDSGLLGRARQHYLWVKIGEVTSLASAPTEAMRIEHVHRGFREARDLSTVVKRVLGDHELPAPHFEHLDRWLAVLSRSSTALHEAA